MKRQRSFSRLFVEMLEDRLTPSGGIHAALTADNTVTAIEDTSFVFGYGDFAFSDPSDTPEDGFYAVKITSLPVAGELTNNGMPVSVGDIIQSMCVAGGDLRFVPGVNEIGANYAAFNFQVQDDGSENVLSAAKTMTIDVTAVNDAPDFAAYDPPTVTEYGDPESIPAWASFLPGGGADEAPQTATYFVTNISNSELFAQLPFVAPNGTLSYTLASYANGFSSFDVEVEDSGGLLSGVRPFAITAARVLAPFTVNTTGDLPDVNVGDGRAIDNQGNTSLRAAIMEANAVPAAVTPSTIQFSLPAESIINLGSALDSLATRITINGPGAVLLSIARSSANNFRIFTIAPTGEVSIRNVKITNGNAAGEDAGGRGGGISNLGKLTLTGVILTGNQAAVAGGGVANAGSSLTIDASNINNNSSAGRGGGVYNGINNRQLFVRNGTIIQTNNALSGGGVFNASNSQATIDGGTQINDNRATGTGILFGQGGGIFNHGTLIMSNVTMNENRSVNQGGGMYSLSSATLTNVAIQNNQATSVNRGKGAGIYIAGGVVELTGGCTVSGNTATALGNGVCLGLDQANTPRSGEARI